MSTLSNEQILQNVITSKLNRLNELEAFKRKLKEGDWLSLNKFNQPLHCESADYKFYAGIKNATVWSKSADWVKIYHDRVSDAMEWVDATIEELKSNM